MINEKSVYNPFSLEGKRIIITGASSGIGRQCAIDCSRMGAEVIMIGRNIERLQETSGMLAGKGHCSISMDVTDIQSTFIQDIVNQFGTIDGFIHAAGIEKTLPFKLLGQSDYQDILDVNVLSAFEISRQLTSRKYMNNGGSIVFISSITSVIARGGLTAYAASKGALNSGARVMALELSKRRIRVNTISPGTILTPMMTEYLSSLSEEDANKRKSGFMLGLGEPTDISNACIYLLSDASRWITGQNLVVDGGYTVQ